MGGAQTVSITLTTPSCPAPSSCGGIYTSTLVFQSNVPSAPPTVAVTLEYEPTQPPGSATLALNGIPHAGSGGVLPALLGGNQTLGSLLTLSVTGQPGQPFLLAQGDPVRAQELFAAGLLGLNLTSPHFEILGNGFAGGAFVLDGSGQFNVALSPPPWVAPGDLVGYQALVGTSLGTPLLTPKGLLAITPGDTMAASTLAGGQRHRLGGAVAFGRHAVTGDVDQDGRDDYVNVSGIFANVQAPGAPVTFEYRSLDPRGAEVAAADFDGDGRLDLVVMDVCDVTSRLHIYRGQPGGVFFWASGLAVSHAPAFSFDFVSHDDGAFLTTDFDQDGRTDLVAASGWYASTTPLVILENTSTPGTISFTPHVIAQAMGVRSLAALDVDGDGRRDLVLDRDGSLSVLSNPGTIASFPTQSFVPLLAGDIPEGGARWLRATDVDGNSLEDLLWAGESSRGVLLQGPSGRFRFSPIEHAPSPTNVAAPFPLCDPYVTRGPEPRMEPWDANLDGLQDVVFVDPDRAGKAWVVVAIQAPPGIFGTLWYLPLYASTGQSIAEHAGHVLPIDIDGVPPLDLVAGGDHVTVFIFP